VTPPRNVAKSPKKRKRRVATAERHVVRVVRLRVRDAGYPASMDDDDDIGAAAAAAAAVAAAAAAGGGGGGGGVEAVATIEHDGMVDGGARPLLGGVVNDGLGARLGSRSRTARKTLGTERFHEPPSPPRVVVVVVVVVLVLVIFDCGDSATAPSCRRRSCRCLERGP
jgi:hypothetical protein